MSEGQNVVHPYNRILLSHKKKEILIKVPIWMSLEDAILSERNQTQKSKFYMIP
jgi:hypothetical protein